jgi:hypothetical protein
MRCRDVEALESAYIDGELDEARASAMRGHLRVCQTCRERVADLATLVEAAVRLEPMEPGPSLWAGIERGLAAAEIADSQRSWLWLRWQALRPRLLPLAVGVAAAAVLVLWAARKDREPAPAVTSGDQIGQASEQMRDQASGQAGPAAEQALAAADTARETFWQATDRDIAEADQRYLDTIEELRAIADQERANWPDDIRAAYDARVQAFDLAASGHRQVLGQAVDVRATGPVGDARARDALYAVYRAEIEFLQRAALQGPERIAAAAITPPAPLDPGGAR